MAKSKSQNKAQIALGFLLLAGIFAMLYWVIAAIWNALSGNPAIGAGIAAATLTGALAEPYRVFQRLNYVTPATMAGVS